MAEVIADGSNLGKRSNFDLLNQVRMVNVIGDAESQIRALLADGTLINSSADDFQLMYGSSVSPDNRHNGFCNRLCQPNQNVLYQPLVLGCDEGQ